MSVDHGDVARKFSVQHAAKSLGGWLAGRGATVEFLHLPDGDGAKTGLDDFLAVGNTIGDVMRLVHPHLPPLRGESTESRHSDAPAPRPEFGSIDGSGVLDDIVEWHARFIRFTHDGDVFLLTLWIAPLTCPSSCTRRRGCGSTRFRTGAGRRRFWNTWTGCAVARS